MLLLVGEVHKLAGDWTGDSGAAFQLKHVGSPSHIVNTSHLMVFSVPASLSVFEDNVL